MQTKDQNHILSRAFISSRVVLKIKLVIFFRIPPLGRRYDLGRHRLLVPLRADFPRNLLGNLVLLVAMCKDRTAVLCADIGSLAVFCCGVVHAVEEFKELGVCHNRRIKCNLKSFGVCG